jgi:hypothetical protein
MTKTGGAWSKFRESATAGGFERTLRLILGRLPRQLQDRLPAVLHPFDRLHGVDTGGLIAGDDLRSGHRHDVFSTAYYGMAPSRLRWVLDSWAADKTHPGISDYSFVDLGCGKGRAVMLASEFGFRVIIGVELHPGLAAIARRNLARWKQDRKNRCPVEILRQEATEFVFPPGACLLYLFNPFATPVVERLIERIEADFATRSGLLDLVYFNPEAEDLLDAHPGFTRLWSGTIPMSEEDAAADTAASPEDRCSVYRWIGGTPNWNDKMADSNSEDNGKRGSIGLRSSSKG